jgi:hypothetical protein
MRAESRGVLYTYSGVVAYPNGTHQLRDIAIGLSREGRYVGQGTRWYPVILHTFVVCDLLPKRLKGHGLLHDSPEYATGDTPKPLKTDESEAMEDQLLLDIYRSLGFKPPTADQHREIKVADREAQRGEVWTVGTQALQPQRERHPQAEDLTLKYVAEYPYVECLEASGRAPMEFMRRFREYSEYMERA